MRKKTSRIRGNEVFVEGPNGGYWRALPGKGRKRVKSKMPGGVGIAAGVAAGLAAAGGAAAIAANRRKQKTTPIAPPAEKKSGIGKKVAQTAGAAALAGGVGYGSYKAANAVANEGIRRKNKKWSEEDLERSKREGKESEKKSEKETPPPPKNERTKEKREKQETPPPRSKPTAKEDYGFFGVEDGDFATVKAKYKTIVREFHPDREPDPAKRKEKEEQLKKVNEVYNRLKERNARRDSLYRNLRDILLSV